MKLGRPERGPGANGGRHVPGPDDPAPGLPGLTNSQAAQLAERYSQWQSYRDHVQPGYLSFAAEVVPLARVIDGERVIEQAIALTAATQLGPIVMHLPAELAEQLAQLMTDKAAEARGGAAVVRSRLFTPGEG